MVDAGKATIIAAIITVSLGFLLTADGPLIQPFFISSITNEEDGRTLVKVKNVGVEQAKNAVIQLETANEWTINYYSCNEGVVDENESIFTINFTRMSYGIDCRVWFDGKNQADVYRMTVTADNAIGHEWSKEQQYYDFILYGIFSALAGIMISGGFTVYFGSRKFREYKEYKLLESSDLSRKSELKQELENISLEKNMLKNFISTIQNPEQVDVIQSKMDSLDSKEYEIRNELDEVYGILGAKKNSRELIGEIFSDWASIEEIILESGKNNDIDLRIKNPMKVIQILAERDEKFKPIYNLVRDYRPMRNDLAHKTKHHKREELEKYRNELKVFLEKLEKVSGIHSKNKAEFTED